MAAQSRLASFVRRLSQNTTIVNVRLRAHTMFTQRYLLITNTAVAIGLGGVGDLISQHYEAMTGIRARWDPIRTKNQCVQGLVFGPLYHYWYIFLDRVNPGSTTSSVLRKLFLDQSIMVPVSVVVFLVIISLLESRSSREMMRDIKQKAPSLLAAEWTFGPASQLINFYIIPMRFRVLYDCCVGLCFDSYYSYINYRKFADHDSDSSRKHKKRFFGGTKPEAHDTRP